MTIQISFPKFPEVAGRIAMVQTPRPDWTAARLARLQEAFAMKATLDEAGTFYLARDRRSVLEVFQASDSVRWSLLEPDLEGRRGGFKPPSEAAARRTADEFLARMGLDGSARANGVSVVEVGTSHSAKNDPEFRTTALQVNYRFSLEGLPVFGPGAKAQVTVGAKGRVGMAYRFWREPKIVDALPTVNPEEAMERLRGHAMFSELDSRSARVTIESVDFGYFAMPPMDVQGHLLPVYVFRGVISTEALQRYEFTKHVIGVRLEVRQLKDSGITVSPVESVF